MTTLVNMVDDLQSKRGAQRERRDSLVSYHCTRSSCSLYIGFIWLMSQKKILNQISLE